MTIELDPTIVPAVGAKTLYKGEGRYDVEAGKSLKMETSPGGADILDVTVPAGKKWFVRIELAVVETDA